MNILYTDNISIIKNDMGVIILFKQTIEGEEIVVSSVGMSNDAARDFENELKRNREYE